MQRTITVYHNPGSGLANRIIALAEALWLGALTNREVSSIWPVTESCGSSLERLFTTHLFRDVHLTGAKTTITVPKILWSQLESRTTLYSNTLAIQQISERNARLQLVSYGESEDQQITKQQFLADKNSDIVIDSSCGLIADKTMADYDTLFSYARKLTPVPKLTSEIERFHHLYLATRRPLIGLHIRREPQDPFWSIRFENSSIEQYITCINRIKEIAPNACFFCATLEVPIITALQRQCDPECLIVYPKTEWTRVTETSIEEAICELYLLSKCQFLLLNIGSTYSWLADRLGPSNHLYVESTMDMNDLVNRVAKLKTNE